MSVSSANCWACREARLYYEPVPDSDLNLQLMRLIDEQYLSRPYFGQRRMTIWLRQQGHLVNVKRVRRLLQIMGLEAIHPGPRLSLASPEHRVFPYLLRGVTIDRPDQVWSTDIMYVPLARGFLYLVAVIDWFSRKVLSWELSNSLEVGFCVSALESALSVSQPEIFNTDQGSQFTSPQFTNVLSSRGIAISMDESSRPPGHDDDSRQMPSSRQSRRPPTIAPASWKVASQCDSKSDGLCRGTSPNCPSW